MYHELAFRQDIRTFTFPSLPVSSEPAVDGAGDNETNKHRPSEEQLEAMNGLVTAMMFDEDESENEEDNEKEGEGEKDNQER